MNKKQKKVEVKRPKVLTTFNYFLLNSFLFWLKKLLSKQKKNILVELFVINKNR